MIDNLAGVLYFSTRGHNRPCGQAIGANGSGNFVKLFYGDKDKARDAAYNVVRALERQGHNIVFTDYVENDDSASYHGRPISFEVIE